MPRVTVCLPTYNRAHYLPGAIESVLNQTFWDFELLIYDNASTDETPDIVKGFRDARIRYVRHPQNIGMPKNWVHAINASTGQYCGILSDDDRWDPVFLERLIAPLDEDESVDVAFSDHWLMDAKGQVLRGATDECTRRFRGSLRPGLYRPFWELALRAEALVPSATLFRRLRLITAGALNVQTFLTSVPAYYLFGQLALAGGGAFYVAERLAYYRLHLQSATETISVQAWREYQLACARLSQQAPRGRALAWIRESWVQATMHEGFLLLCRDDRWGAMRAFSRGLCLAPFRARPWIGLVVSFLGIYRWSRSLHARSRSFLHRLRSEYHRRFRSREGGRVSLRTLETYSLKSIARSPIEADMEKTSLPIPPRVSICLPTFNRAHYLQGAIQNILSQTFRDFELIVCDNASTDKTREFVANFRDSRIRYIRNSNNIGVAANWIKAIQLATGEYCTIIGDDDQWHPTFLERMLTPLVQDINVDIAFCDHWLIDATGTELLELTNKYSRAYGRAGLKSGLHKSFLGMILPTQPICHVAALMRRKSLVAAGALDPRAGKVIDYYIFMQLAMAGGGAFYIPERLAYYRIHPESASARFQVQVWRDMQWACTKLLGQHPRGIAATHLRHTLSEAVTSEGLALLREDDRWGAMRTFGRALRMAPLSVRPWLGLGLLLFPNYWRRHLNHTSSFVENVELKSVAR